MPDTSGFEVVAEVAEATLQSFLLAAYESSVIPHSTPIAAGTTFAGYQVRQGLVNISRDGLDLELVPAQDRIRLVLPTEVQVELQNPPVPSARLFDLDARLDVLVQAARLGTERKVGLLLATMPRSAVTATLTSGDPVGPITQSLVAEYIAARFNAGTPPRDPPPVTNVSFLVATATATAHIGSETVAVNGNQVTITLPVRLRFVQTSQGSGGLRFPMGVDATVVLTATLQPSAGRMRCDLTVATVEVTTIDPVPGTEGDAYTTNKALAGTQGFDLEAQLRTRLETLARAAASGLGVLDVAVPTVAQIEQFIGDRAHEALVGHGDIPVWTPDPPAGTVTVSDDIRIRVLAGALAIGLNPGPAADANGLTNFVPAGRAFAIAIDGAKVLAIIREQIDRPESDGGFGGIPHTFPDIEGHEARLTRLDPSLVTDSIHLEGDVTVVDAIAGKIDVDAGFEADVGLRWEDAESNTQKLQAFKRSSSVSVGVLAWILAFLLGFISFGLIGGIIGLVIVAVVNGIADQVGGAIIRDQVTDQVKGIGAWPQTLDGVGTVVSRFEDPVDIDPEGVRFSG